MKYKENWKVLLQRIQEKHLKSLLCKTVQVLGCEKKKKKIKIINTKSSKLHTAKSRRKFCNSLYQNERTCAQELKEEARGHVI